MKGLELNNYIKLLTDIETRFSEEENGMEYYIRMHEILLTLTVLCTLIFRTLETYFGGNYQLIY